VNKITISDPITSAADWLTKSLSDTKIKSALKRASTLEEFQNSWYLASLLATLDSPKNDQLLTSIWGAAVAKSVCDGSLAAVAKRHGLNEKHWRKLTATTSRVEAARQVRRISRQLDAVPVKDIIEKLFYWGTKARRDWAVEWFKLNGEQIDAT
jgi:hypothetical protein